VGIFLALQFGLGALVLLQIVEVFQKQQPGGLLSVMKLSGTTGLFPEDVIDVLKACSNTGT